MTDLSSTIIAKSDQLNGDDLIGKSITIKITKVSLVSSEQPVAIHYEGDNGKPWKPCKSMMRVLVFIWGADGKVFVGRSLTLFRDEKVTWAGLEVGGIRISHMSDISSPVTIALTKTRGNKKPFVVQPLKTTPQSVSTITEADIAELTEQGDAKALESKDALGAWWKSLGGEKHKALGKEFIENLKKIASDNEVAI